jgi:hypothetical protein
MERIFKYKEVYSKLKEKSKKHKINYKIQMKIYKN